MPGMRVGFGICIVFALLPGAARGREDTHSEMQDNIALVVYPSVVPDLLYRPVSLVQTCAYEGATLEVHIVGALRENTSYILKWKVGVSLQDGDLENSYHAGTHSFLQTSGETAPLQVEILPLRPGRHQISLILLEDGHHAYSDAMAWGDDESLSSKQILGSRRISINVASVSMEDCAQLEYTEVRQSEVEVALLFFGKEPALTFKYDYSMGQSAETALLFTETVLPYMHSRSPEPLLEFDSAILATSLTRKIQCAISAGEDLLRASSDGATAVRNGDGGSGDIFWKRFRVTDTACTGADAATGAGSVLASSIPTFEYDKEGRRCGAAGDAGTDTDSDTLGRCAGRGVAALHDLDNSGLAKGHSHIAILIAGLFKPGITDDLSLPSIAKHVIAAPYEVVDLYLHLEAPANSGWSDSEVEERVREMIPIENLKMVLVGRPVGTAGLTYPRITDSPPHGSKTDWREGCPCPRCTYQFFQLQELYPYMVAEEVRLGQRYSHVVRARSDVILAHTWPGGRQLERIVPPWSLAGPNLASLQGCDKFWISSREIARDTMANLVYMFQRPLNTSRVAQVLGCDNQTDPTEKYICDMAARDLWAEAIMLSFFYSIVPQCSLVDSCEVTGEFIHNARQYPVDRLCRSRKGWHGDKRVYNAREIDYYSARITKLSTV